MVCDRVGVPIALVFVGFVVGRDDADDADDAENNLTNTSAPCKPTLAIDANAKQKYREQPNENQRSLKNPTKINAANKPRTTQRTSTPPANQL